jgi:carboxyl-terminal processing protease
MIRIKKTYFILSILLIVSFVLNIFLYKFEPIISSPINENLDLKLLNKIYRDIKDKYVEDIDENLLIKSGIDGLVGVLDPYTAFYDQKKANQLKSITTGEYGGIGFYVSMIDGNFTVVSPMEDSPAKKVGIRPGDVVIKVDGIDVTNMEIDEITEMIKGEQDTKVNLTIKRKGFSNSIEFTVVRKNIQVKDVPYYKMLDNYNGYIKLNHFSKNASIELAKTINELQKSGLKSLILDVRGNPGGLLTSSVDVVELFLKKGELIVSTKGKNGKSISEHRAGRDKTFYEKPLIILVDELSASASEILAGAIQDIDRGIIIGRKTFGKGLVQTIFYPTPQTALKLTTARYYTPSGRCIDGTKIKNSSDSTNSKENIYYTNSGRKVYGGGGISPDINVQNNNEHVSEWVNQSLFLKYAIEYANRNPNIEFMEVNNEILHNFKEFVSQNWIVSEDSNFKKIEELEKIGTKRNYGNEYKNNVQKLKKIIREKEINKIDFSNPSIKYNLQKEINWVIGGDFNRIKSTINDDDVIKEAIKILNEPDRYNKILKNVNIGKGSSN